MRAIQPTNADLLELDGFRIGYETFGDPTRPALLLLPTWQIVHSRIWKMQVPFLACYFHVITVDFAGNGLGERTTDPAAYEYERIARQAIGVLNHLGIECASVVAFSRGCDYAILMAATEPDRVESLTLIGNGVTCAAWQPQPDDAFQERRDTYVGWEKRNAHYFVEGWDDWLEFFFSEIFPEPHSTKPIDDAIGWARETTPEVLIATVPNRDLLPRLAAAEAVARIRCPVLLVHGDDDRCSPIEASYDLAAARPDWELVVLEGAGHGPLVRDPVRMNILIHEFLSRRLPSEKHQSVRHASN